MNLSNIKIGKKIALVLVGVLVVTAALAALSLWGVSSNQKDSVIVYQRLTKARLAETVAAETTGIASDIAQMILEKRQTGDVLDDIAGRRKNRFAALERFKALADTPTSIKHGADLAELVQAAVDQSKASEDLLAAGRLADSQKQFKVYLGTASRLRSKATEAAQFQQTKADAAEKAEKETASTTWTWLIVGSLFAMTVAVVGGIVLTRGIAAPIGVFVGHLAEIAKGDLSKNALAEFLAREDEIGSMARAKQALLESLRLIIQQLSNGVQVLSASSTELRDRSTHMTSGSRQASDRAHSVSAAAEEMSSNITTVAAGMEQTTTNLAHVATATEEMTSTIGEIAQNSEKARRITDEATRQASRITEQINQLGAAAREIGKVTETITEISSQTNLLALNATIEAARAGAAGKGFAVVATEIKTLAQQTAGATEDIKSRIAGVQAATASGIAEISKISEVISDVSSIVVSIAAAIEEQSAATKDIARHISEASLGVTDANSRVAQTSQVSREIAKDIVSVDQAAREMANGSEHVRGSSAELATVADQLRVTIARFRISSSEPGVK